MKYITGLVLCILFVSCNTLQENIKKHKRVEFTSFELSYNDGSIKTFGFRLDSNKIFFSPKTWDSIYYGIIPDTLFTFIDSIISESVLHRQFKVNKIDCEDCSAIGVLIVTNQDTIKIKQGGKDIDKAFYEIIRPIDNFIHREQHNILTNVAMVLETNQLILPLPPPIKTRNKY